MKMIIRQRLFFLFKVSDLWFVLIKVINVYNAKVQQMKC